MFKLLKSYFCLNFGSKYKKFSDQVSPKLLFFTTSRSNVWLGCIFIVDKPTIRCTELCKFSAGGPPGDHLGKLVNVQLMYHPMSYSGYIIEMY